MVVGGWDPSSSAGEEHRVLLKGLGEKVETESDMGEKNKSVGESMTWEMLVRSNNQNGSDLKWLRGQTAMLMETLFIWLCQRIKERSTPQTASLVNHDSTQLEWIPLQKDGKGELDKILHRLAFKLRKKTRQKDFHLICLLQVTPLLNAVHLLWPTDLWPPTGTTWSWEEESSCSNSLRASHITPVPSSLLTKHHATHLCHFILRLPGEIQ